MYPIQKASLSALSRVWRHLYRVRAPRVCILNYHSINTESRIRSTTSPRLFEDHMEWLSSECRVLPLREIAGRPLDSLAADRPVVALTFDDGYADIFERAFPVLQRYGFSATLFLTVGFIDRDETVLRRFAKLANCRATQCSPLSWDQVREMSRHGIEAAAHTFSHPNLVHLETPDLDFELRDARSRLEERVGAKVDGFAYPFGKPTCHLNRRVVDAVASAGYGYAVTVTPRGVLARDGCFLLPRIGADGKPLTSLIESVTGAWDFMGYYYEFAPRPLGQVLSPRAFRRSSYGGSYREMQSS